jgi:ankyrin repeat protein
METKTDSHIFHFYGKDRYNETALFHAAAAGNTEIVNILIAAKANVDHANKVICVNTAFGFTDLALTETILSHRPARQQLCSLPEMATFPRVT